MAEQRLTLISDPTAEFPGNTNSSFKVRLPTTLNLVGSGWHVSLLSLSVPDRTLDRGKFQKKNVHSNTVGEGIYNLTVFRSGSTSHSLQGQAGRVVYVTLDDLLKSDHGVVTGTEFWRKFAQLMQRGIMRDMMEYRRGRVTKWATDASKAGWNPWVLVKKTHLPSVTVEDDTMTVKGVSADDALRSTDKTVVQLSLGLELCVALGFLVKDTSAAQGYVLGRNVSYEFEEVDTTDTAVYTGTDSDGDHWRGKSFLADRDRTPNIPSNTEDDLFQIGATTVGFYNRVTWRFSDLDASFARLTGHAKETVMVYTDLVQPTVVGGQLAPLLKEIEVGKSGEGRSTVEPRHRQWVPVRTNSVQIVEVELSDPTGALKVFSAGQTIVTLGLRQMV